MIKLGSIRKELENYDYCGIIYNLSSKGCQRFNLKYDYIYQLLMEPDDYEIYEVIYDWDDYGFGDGSDVICFYEDNEGFLAKNEKARIAYGG